MWTSFI